MQNMKENTEIISSQANSEKDYENGDILQRLHTHTFLDFLDIHDDNMLVGGSDFSGRYWDGNIYVSTISQEGEISTGNLEASINTIAGSADGCFLDNPQRIILCEDSGAIEVWSFVQDQNLWVQESHIEEHDSAVLTIGCLVPNNLYVTAGADENIKAWDVKQMRSTRDYRKAHSHVISQVAVQPGSSDVFVTGSLDHEVKLWDYRLQKSVSALVNNDAVRCVQWLDEHHVMFGDEAGSLKLVDSRNIQDGKSTKTLHEFPVPVHKIEVERETKKMAVCCDNATILTFDASNKESLNIIYENSSHRNFVRGLAWDTANKNVLYSSGWDGLVKKHIIPNI
ncbi:methylosome protein 50-like isoform X2 [Leptidea sinapis]|nr:methylosome protein 50-like isoform X2 [Leptidea sinapis]